MALIGWYEGFKQGQESHQGTSAEAYKQQADAQINAACLALSGVPQYECIAQAISAEREQQRAEQDLDAQQQMAEWARWMLIATVIMAAVTGFGVVFVWQTLKATQDMAKETSRIGEAQVRAYLGRESCAAWEGTGVEFCGTITNCGNSPAINVYMMLELTYFRSIGENTFEIREFYTIPQSIGTVPAHGQFGTGRVAFLGFFGGGGGTYDVRFANLCLLGQDAFGHEISFFGPIGYFQSFDEYDKKKIHPGNITPGDMHGNRRKSLSSMREWVAKAEKHK
ncbi:hypothetical protein GVY41_17230 [Frigidibacter albus]|uniref:Uncharacterized protein n=1 Tax=Frigidibacter albus TaxID=1465486 RepID=A0A6L8VJQ7_9RHOB|nr:hypothetical protein [Frigidibacter albus]MZQ90598.1 hypothetical protein [Frigidibacter albus]NBE32746.1 hypothetical protein [Frigidibacter albus]